MIEPEKSVTPLQRIHAELANIVPESSGDAWSILASIYLQSIESTFYQDIH